MGFILFFALFTVSTNVFAPLLPEFAGEESNQKALAELKLSNTELSKLLRAQTEAIKSLSNRLDLLEQRIDKIEKRQQQ